MDAVLILVLLLVNIPLYKIIGKMIFKDEGEFWEAINYNFIPDLISLFRGRFAKDFFAELKLSFFLLCCGVVIFLEYVLIKGIIKIFA